MHVKQCKTTVHQHNTYGGIRLVEYTNKKCGYLLQTSFLYKKLHQNDYKLNQELQYLFSEGILSVYEVYVVLNVYNTIVIGVLSKSITCRVLSTDILCKV